MIKLMIFSKDDLKQVEKEIDCLKKYQNKYIVKYIGNFIHENRPFIVTKYYNVNILFLYFRNE